MEHDHRQFDLPLSQLAAILRYGHVATGQVVSAVRQAPSKIWGKALGRLKDRFVGQLGGRCAGIPSQIAQKAQVIPF